MTDPVQALSLPEMFIEALRTGVAPLTAAAFVGVEEDVLRTWLNDPQFIQDATEAMDEAEKIWITILVGNTEVLTALGADKQR